MMREQKMREALEYVRSYMYVNDYGDWALNCDFDVSIIDESIAQREAQEPGAYQYKYECPITGDDVWRDSNESWNGQYPHGCRKLYTSPQPAQVPSEWVEVVRNLLRWMPVYPKSAEAIVGGHQSYDAAIDAARALLAKQEGK